MKDVAIIAAIVSLAVPLYVYVGYPILLFVLDRLLPPRDVAHTTSLMRVTMLVSCYNEEDVIAQKIANCLALDYPEELIEFVFVSDASSDQTDEIIRGVDDARVRLVRQEERLGKSMGLNAGVQASTGEILVFSDANAMYAADAIRKLVRNFASDEVGYVVGYAKYSDSVETTAGQSEDSYWQYEILLKVLESRRHSVVGGDGAIYAIRRALFSPLEFDDINDFVNPLQIVAAGYRGIFDREAVCYEQTAGDFEKEARRKARIVNRSFNAVAKNKSLLNPLRFGFFSIQLWSHKVLRWFVPVFLLTAAVAILVSAAYGIYVAGVAALLGIVFAWSVVLGRLLRRRSDVSVLVLLPYYFYIVNLGALIGVFRALRGDIQVTWSTPRSDAGGNASTRLRDGLLVTAVLVTSLAAFLFVLQKIIGHV